MSLTYTYLRRNDPALHSVEGVTRVRIKGGSVAFLGAKRRVLLMVTDDVLQAAWRDDAVPSHAAVGDSFAIDFANRPPLSLVGVDEVDVASDAVERPRYIVLHGGDDLPVAVLNASELTAVSRGGIAPREKQLRSIALTPDVDGRLMLIAIDADIPAPGPNVFSMTQLDDGSWTDWAAVGDAHLTDVTAALATDGIISLYGCDEGLGPHDHPNLFRGRQRAPDGTLAGVEWAPFEGTLTSLSVASNPFGDLVLVGANAGIPGEASNVFVADVPDADVVQWRTVDRRTSVVEAAVQPDGHLVLIDADLTARYSNVAITGGGRGAVAVGEYFDSVAAIRRVDGRLQFFGSTKWTGSYRREAKELIQSSPSGPVDAPWNRIGIGLSEIAATTTSDGRVHVVGVRSENEWSRELVYRSELVAGGPWTGWRRIVRSIEP